MKKRDIHTERAAALFNVAPEAVTPQMRKAAKSQNYMALYVQPSPKALHNLKTDEALERPLQDGDADWLHGCDNCGEKPTVHPTGLCGPCCFGEASTINGNW